ncbi:MAG: hypothetical protein ABIR56_17920, partial [Polaromonas sp.]
GMSAFLQADALGDFVGMPVTSKAQPAPALQLAAGPLPGGGTLPLTSWVKTDTVFSLCESQIVKTIGQVGDENRNYCVQQLCQYLNRGR